MGMTAANKAVSVVDNVRLVLGIELLCACQGIDLRGDLQPGKPLRGVLALVRRDVPFVDKDRMFQDDLAAVDSLVRSNELLAAVGQHLALH